MIETTAHHRKKEPSAREFGFVFSGFFLLVALAPLLKHGALRLWALPVSALFLLLTLLAPQTLSPFAKAWARLGELLHRVVSPLVLGAIYYTVLSPMGVLFRAMGKDFLRRKNEPGAVSYWVARNPPGPDSASLKNQF